MKTDISALLVVENFIDEHARVIRNENVLTDEVVAKLYEISVEEVHSVVEKDKRRFPSDFMFLLNGKEKKKLLSKRDKIYVFTWGGILMLGGQLKSTRAIRTHMQMIELFVGQMPGKVFEILSEIQSIKK